MPEPAPAPRKKRKKKGTLLGSEPVIAAAAGGTVVNGVAHPLMDGAGAPYAVHLLVHGCIVAGSVFAARSKVSPVKEPKDPV